LGTAGKYLVDGQPLALYGKVDTSHKVDRQPQRGETPLKSEFYLPEIGDRD
jgi:hypothetical protein